MFLLTGLHLQAQGFRITVDVPGFQESELYLAYYLADKQYVQDTAVRQGSTFVFEGPDPLPAGFYLVVFPPDNTYFQLLVEKEDQDIRVQVDPARKQRPVSIKGSPESERFYAYVDFISARRPEAEALQAQLEGSDGARRQQLEKQLAELNKAVDARQLQEMRDRPRSLTAMLIAANREITIPEFRGSEEEVNEQRYQYYRKHYFDQIPLRDPRIVRTPFLHEKIDYFINKLTVQSPDSISRSIDFILSQMDPDGDVFKLYLVHFLNTYAKSKIVGMDAVYVHIVNRYYARGMAPWTDEEQLGKIIENARKLEPILIGKIAPDIRLQDQQDRSVTLHGVDAPYTVLYFWAPDCGHCKKSIPELVEFYRAYRDKGVEVLAVCTKLRDEVGDCWEAVDDRGMDIWVNAVDPFLRSRYKQIYDVRVTPKIYVLDHEKRIVMKNIGSEQLPQVLDHLLENQQ